MANEESGAEKPTPKMVPLAELVDTRKKLQEKLKTLEGQNTELRQEKINMESELSIAKSKMEDEDIVEVKKDLLKRDSELSDREMKLASGETAFKEREKAIQVKELIAEYKAQGIELDEDSLLAADDPRDIVMAEMAESLTRKEEPPKETEEEPIYESGPAATSKKMPKDMTDEEFQNFEKEELEKTMAKR